MLKKLLRILTTRHPKADLVWLGMFIPFLLQDIAVQNWWLIALDLFVITNVLSQRPWRWTVVK